MSFQERLVVAKQRCDRVEGSAVSRRPLVHNTWSDLSMRKAMADVESGGKSRE